MCPSGKKKEYKKEKVLSADMQSTYSLSFHLPHTRAASHTFFFHCTFSILSYFFLCVKNRAIQYNIMKMCNCKLIYRLICNIYQSAKVCYSHNVVGIHTIRFETDTHCPVSVSKRTKYFGNGYPFQKRTSVS